MILTVLWSWALAPFAQAAPLPASDLSYSAAANDLAQKVVAGFPKLNGYVLSAESGTIYVDLGEKDRVYPGMELNLYREGDPFTHPITGEVLGRLEKPLGKVRLLEVREKFSIAAQISKVEDAPVTKGDRVRMTGARIPLALPTIEMVEAKGEEAKSVTRELALALTRTERFEVWEERSLLSALQGEGVPEPVSFTDPRVLEILSKKLNIPILGFGKLSGLFIDLQIFSTSTRSLLTVASTEIRPFTVRPPTEVARPIFPEKEPPPPRPIAPSESISPPEAAPTAGAWKGPRWEKALNALVVADVNGDRQPELAVATKDEIMIYSIEPAGYRLLHTTPKQTGINILSLDAADINGNGIAEIFATSYFQGRLNSFALEYRGGAFAKTWENVDRFLRCLPTDPKGGYQLFGQALGSPDRPWGKIHQYVWSGSGYRQGPSLDLPVEASLYGLALMDIDGDGKRETIFLSQSNHIEIYGEDGKRKYRTSEEYGGSKLTVEVSAVNLPPNNPTSPMNAPETQQPQSFYLQTRLFPIPGKPQLYVSKNIESELSVLKGIRFFGKSKIYRLAWDGDTLQPAWESKEFSTYMADYHEGDFDGDGTPEIAILLVEKRMVEADQSSVTIYRL